MQYAEWLESTGNPNDSLRAEFIRVQCELAHLHLSDDRWSELFDREQSLNHLQEHWAEELPQLDGVIWNSTHYLRGFVWDVCCDDAEAFQQNAAVIFASAPIQSLSFHRLKSLIPVLEIPAVRRIRRLILEGLELTSNDAQALATSTTVSNLTALHIAHNSFGDAGVKAIAGSPYLRSLDDLDLGHNLVGDDGIVTLAASPVVATLSHLGLAGNLLTDIGAMALASSPYLNRLTGLTLWDCMEIGIEGKAALQARFDETASLED